MNNIAMQNRQPEKIPKAMLRLMFALVVLVLIAVSVARVSGLLLDPVTPKSNTLVVKAHVGMRASPRAICDRAAYRCKK